MANLINWLEIPVTDMDRATKFYTHVLKANVQINEGMAPGFTMGFLHTPEMDIKDIGGALVEGPGYIPGQNNTLIYLNGNEVGGVDAVLKRVTEAGGKVTAPKMLITEDIGYCGFFTDSEGNRMAVHSKK